MKNSLLATAIASTLLLASSAHAFTGKIEFTGKLVDKNPYWSISIPAKSIQDAKGWKSKMTDGKAIKGDKTEFSFKKDIPFVQGHMTKLLTKKDASGQLITTGVDPIITIAGYKLDWKENNESGTSNKPKVLSVKIKGKAYGYDIKDGKLELTLTDGFSFGNINGPTKFIYGDKSSNIVQLRAAKNLLPSLNEKLSFPGPIYHSNISSEHAVPEKNKNFTNYMGSFATTLSNFKATFDNDAIPEKWTASIPVTISYK